ncbi:MAG TPA: bifunctional 4-hydroxy-2-oxoglutarate aldolase/2-dehydro-3-deoxy-phosphogluconate aldolase [Caldithrix abyssi]|uniref:Bifunctional 4-hydroxy-2-oxoglutarate aldolase/2-dehydro-3-deoxy-phosphogluconate aldolase n=1 Tax=Caldithrix abyssi TaxID=187145 RepID=A0A7V1M0E2_CALAY|nr:bifunctional 4-hydroxy-2-oxoglutarate aldolase/2-dehydro-3-deoxy-phosphogluconate aldolase [Caldithrix abyssi]
MSRKEITRKIMESGAVAVVRLPDADKLLKAAAALRLGGLEAIEITMTTPGALQAISRLAGEGFFVGVGSVLDGATARRAVEAGARYVVSPVYKKEIIEAAHAGEVPALPGAFSPTEIQQAFEAGADIVKVFPANISGMAFFKAVLAPMPHLRLMPTGGVTVENAGEWIRAGACAVGVGSALLNKEIIARGEWELLTRRARELCDNIKVARAKG